MTIAYSFLKCLAGEGNGFIAHAKRLKPEKAIEYLMRPGVMRGKLLGACLDSCRIGSMNTCYWPVDVDGMMNLIQRWREENDDNPGLYHERKLEDLYTKFDLPWIKHEHCPRDKNHKITVVDSAGNLRCGHNTLELIRPSFTVDGSLSWDSHSQTHIRNFYEEKPADPTNYDEGGEDITDEKGYQEYLENLERYETEEPIEVKDTCYSIIKESRTKPMAFETILRRENIQPAIKTKYCGDAFGNLSKCKKDKSRPYCLGHDVPNSAVEFFFDGWTLALYVQKWKEQGDAPWFANKKEQWPSRINLRISSED
jgi:hypothetical protein